MHAYAHYADTCMYTHIIHSRVNDKMTPDSNIQKTVDACIVSTSNKTMSCNNYVSVTIDDTVLFMVLHMHIKSCVIIICNVQCMCVHVYLLSLLMCVTCMYSLNVCYGLPKCVKHV